MFARVFFYGLFLSFSTLYADDTGMYAPVANHNMEIVRTYERPTTKKESDMIYYIVTTLGNGGKLKVAKEAISLERTRPKLDSLHPLRFAEVIFSNEELKPACANIRGKMWWNKFRHGLTKSLGEESKKHNLTLEQIHDFAQNVNIDPDFIVGPLQKGEWNEFLDILIDKVPRKGEPGRYDM